MSQSTVLKGVVCTAMLLSLGCSAMQQAILHDATKAGIGFRRACLEDIDKILQLYTQFTEDDKDKLLVFPPHLQKDIIIKNIQKGRLFVALDNESGNITSFLKLHIVDKNEIGTILNEELCLGQNSPIVKEHSYHFAMETVNDFKSQLAHVETPNATLSQTEKELIRGNKAKSCLFLYHGSAYTGGAYRGRGISTQLLQYAFDSFKKSFAHKKFLALLYGQVDANTNNVAMIRVFAKCLAESAPSRAGNGITLQHLISRAFKPEVDENGNLEIIHDQKHAGIGNMVIFTTDIGSPQ